MDEHSEAIPVASGGCPWAALQGRLAATKAGHERAGLYLYRTKENEDNHASNLGGSRAAGTRNQGQHCGFSLAGVEVSLGQSTTRHGSGVKSQRRLGRFQGNARNGLEMAEAEPPSGAAVSHFRRQ